MIDWGLATLAFAAITGGIGWVVFFGYELFTLEPPMPAKMKKVDKILPKKAA